MTGETDMHKFKLQQAVVPSHCGPEPKSIWEVVNLLPVQADEAPQYRIRERDSGVERAVNEREIKSLFDAPDAGSRSV